MQILRQTDSRTETGTTADRDSKTDSGWLRDSGTEILAGADSETDSGTYSEPDSKTNSRTDFWDRFWDKF